jgi:hypothetical protein
MAERSRMDVLSALGAKGWYTEHVGSVQCEGRCVIEASDPTCDVGEALFRLRVAEITRRPMPSARSR